jgi:Flp pilus assembly protein TadG
MPTVWSNLVRGLNAFRAARAGNVAITFALASLPIVGTIGFAVDYSRANSVKVAMQAALDSTALMLSKDAATITSSALQSKATAYFNALFTAAGVSNIQISATYTTTGGSQVIVNGSGSVATDFLGLIGYNSMPVAGTATAAWGSSRLRVALVLDNTGSMADSGKMTALKSATQSLLTQLQSAASTNGDVYVSIIPFVKDVNLGSANWSSDYLYWDNSTKSDNNSWDANNGTCSAGNYSPRSTCAAKYTCSISGYNSQNSCTSAGSCTISGYYSQSSCTSAGKCSNTSYTTQSKCTSKGYTWTAGVWTSGTWSAATWTPKSHSTWNGCVVDRGNSTAPDTVGNYDTNAVEPTTTISSTLYATEQYSSCPQAVMGLSYDWSSMSTLVNNMSPAGNTNQGIGLQLGWLSLVGGGPFTAPAMDSNYQYQQIIILLTDGLNTQDRWYTNQNSIDARQALTCANAKAARITIYTVQVNTGGDPTSTLLQNCASSSDKFFLLTSASAIATTFNTIGTNLTKLRVAN